MEVKNIDCASRGTADKNLPRRKVLEQKRKRQEENHFRKKRQHVQRPRERRKQRTVVIVSLSKRCKEVGRSGNSR
jgi:hypothetical protein